MICHLDNLKIIRIKKSNKIIKLFNLIKDEWLSIVQNLLFQQKKTLKWKIELLPISEVVYLFDFWQLSTHKC